MTSRRFTLTIFALLASAAAVVFLAISIDANIYAPGAHEGGRQARVLGAIARHVPPRFQHDLEPAFFFRKLYSVIAFSILAFFLGPLVPRARRIATCAAIVAGFSLAIEIAQRLTISHESNVASLFDIGCGAAGGVIGAMTWNVASARFRR